jgi:glucose-1-phosphate cytidylyltransferase
MKAVILAGGLGARIAEESDHRPKPMVEIGGKPLLWHIMKTYSFHGIRDFVICLGYKGYVIKEYFINYYSHTSDLEISLGQGSHRVLSTKSEDWTVTLVDTGSTTMTGGRLKRVAHYLGNETFCLTYGDGLSDVDIGASIEFHRQHRRLATVTAVQPPGRFGVLRLNESASVTSFEEKVDNDAGWINGGYFVLEPGVLDYIAGDDTSWEQTPLRNLSGDGELVGFHHRGFWQPCDTLRDKRQLETLWNTKHPPWAVWEP